LNTAPVNVSVLLSLFAMVNVFAPVLMPTTPLPKLMLGGESVTADIPFPESGTGGGFRTALVAIVSEPTGWLPAVVGVRYRATVHEPPAGTVGVRHVDDGSIPYGLPAVTDSEVTVKLVVCSFVTGTTLSALDVFTTTLPKFTEAGDTSVGAMPVPVSAAVSAVLEPRIKTASEVGGTAPTTVGVSVTEMLHCEFDPSVVPQVVDASLYGAGTVIEVMVIDVVS
jgi:hypothetical protein